MEKARATNAREGSGTESGKYVRYTEEQVDALERVYRECPKPNSMKRQQLLRECPILANIEPKQIKVWFQNRRCREKQRKESTRLLALHQKLSAMNKVLVKHNHSLSHQALQMLRLNHGLRRQLKLEDRNASPLLANNCRRRSMPELPPWDPNPVPSRLTAFAEECLSEFLAKATGTSIEWIQIPAMKPGPDSLGLVSLGHGCEGAASRACSLIGMDASRVSDVLKDRLSWLPDCHRMEILGAFTTSSGATVELLYTQMYSPTHLTQARDFCTLRYTTVLEERNLVVCERSLNLAYVPSHEGFVRAEMYPSGYLIRSCASVGSIVYIVDHLDLKAGCAPEVLRTTYESSSAIAQKMTVVALRHLRSLAQEAAGEAVTGGTLQPAALRALSLRISRSFNDAVNSFSEDGWVSIVNNNMEDVFMSLNTSWDPQVSGLKCMPCILWSAGCANVLCAQASMLLQNISPATFVRFLREHRSEWADSDFDGSSSDILRTGIYGASAVAGAEIGRREVPMPLAHSVENQEIMELVKFEGQNCSREGSILSKETYLLQVCNGVNEAVIGDSAQLVFAPVDGALSADIPLLPSGFRVTPLYDSFMDCFDRTCSLKEASAHESTSDVDTIKHETLLRGSRSIVTTAFQFGYESQNRDPVSLAARRYIHTLIASLQCIARAMAPRVGLALALKSSPFTMETLPMVKQIVSSYRIYFGVHLLGKQPLDDEDLLRTVWHHSHAIICCKLKSPAKIVFSNDVALRMIEPSGTLGDMILDQIADESANLKGSLNISKVLQEGFAYFPSGIHLSKASCPVAYERAVAWKVFMQNEESHHVAFMFLNCSI